ncbi:MAG: AAA family ATPase [Lachnospiraceae bacterium]|nr:AAA family ATPase [Lachnospiraceae bacterium]
MGIYVNPGNQSFQEAVDSLIYVDKSELIGYTNSVLKTQRKNICVSRPRRFGKSMAADMLVAYYSCGCDSQELFGSLKVAQGNQCTSCQEQESEGKRMGAYSANLNQHNVIRFDVQRFLFDESHVKIFIKRIQEAIIKELKEEFGECIVNEHDLYGLPGVLGQIYACTGKGFIFVIDEWDCVFRLAKENAEAQKKYLGFLRGLFKGSEYVELAYMTGILPIKKYGEHSALNLFDEYSMTDPKGLGGYFGFTEKEVQEQCERYGMDFGEMEKWYDGYQLGDSHIYNPKSVVDALTWKKVKSYWTGTETYEALKAYIERNFDGLREAVVEMLGGGHCRIDPTTFQNDMTTFHTKDDILTLMVHLGYLTYGEQSSQVFIPNQEIAQEFLRAIKVGGWGRLMETLNRSEDLLRSTWAMDTDAVAKGVEEARKDMSSILQYNDENSMACALYAAYASAQAYYMKPIRELPSGRGFADIVYLPLRDVGRPALLIELKWDKSAQGAIQQIKDKKYADWVEGYTGDILLVAINYDKKKDMHECMIEKHAKE